MPKEVGKRRHKLLFLSRLLILKEISADDVGIHVWCCETVFWNIWEKSGTVLTLAWYARAGKFV